jgi:hypothetical protein
LGKRQIRIKATELPEQISDITGTEVNVVLLNRVVVHGVIFGANKQGLLIRDMLHREHQLPFNSIQEILLDKEANY